MKEYTGGSVGYYSVEVQKPTTEGRAPYIAECNDLIEALGMNYAEGNAFKALWRRCAARMGKSKEGYKDGLYDAEKIVFFGNRLVEQERSGSTSPVDDDGWIEWHGGECPVELGTLVDIKTKDGDISTRLHAGMESWEDDSEGGSCALNWCSDIGDGTIIAYRLSHSKV